MVVLVGAGAGWAVREAVLAVVGVVLVRAAGWFAVLVLGVVGLG
jgi:hypothetical protein